MASNDHQADPHWHDAGAFATTHWSLVLAAGERVDAESDQALEKLCQAYWPPPRTPSLGCFLNLMRQLDWSLFAERGFERKSWVLGSPGRSTVPAIVERAGPTGKELETAAFESVVAPHEGSVVSAEDL